MSLLALITRFALTGAPAAPPSEVLFAQKPGERFNEFVADADVAASRVAANGADARVEDHHLQTGARLAENLPRLVHARTADLPLRRRPTRTPSGGPARP